MYLVTFYCFYSRCYIFGTACNRLYSFHPDWINILDNFEENEVPTHYEPYVGDMAEPNLTLQEDQEVLVAQTQTAF